MKKKKSSSRILLTLGAALCAAAVVLFVLSSILLLFRTDGTNMVKAACDAFSAGIASLFGKGRASSYTYGLMGLGAVTLFVMAYFIVVFVKVKKYNGIVAAVLATVDMVIVVFLVEAALLSVVAKGAQIRVRAYGGLLLTLLPTFLSLVSLVVYQIVSFADVAGENRGSKKAIDELQKQINELRERIADLEGNQVAQPAAQEEAPVEEAKEEPVTEEEPAPVEEAPVVVAEENGDRDTETVVDEATGLTYIVRYNKSYKAKITLASEDVQNWYNEVKNYILSFGANSRVSWNYDSFNVGRKTVVKLNITGKTLSIYLALDPKEYVESKYHAKDVSESRKYEQTPTQMKIKSARGVKFAKELVDAVMATVGKESNGAVAGDFHEEPKTFDELLAAELIKQSRSLVKAVAAPAEEVVSEPVAEEEPAPVEETPVEEAPETPVEEVVEEGEEVNDVEEVEEPEELETEEEAEAEEKEEKDPVKKERTIYHVSKRENDGREWKVFKQGSKKVIKLFPTQKEALDYAKQLAKNKDDGSYVLLHGLDGKIRKY